jgi:hypothetical protein
MKEQPMIRLSQDYPQYLIRIFDYSEPSVGGEFIDCENGKITTNGDRLFAELSDPKNVGLRMQLKNINGAGIRQRPPGNPLQFVIPMPEEGTPDYEAKRASAVETLFHVMKPKPAA